MEPLWGGGNAEGRLGESPLGLHLGTWLGRPWTCAHNALWTKRGWEVLLEGVCPNNYKQNMASPTHVLPMSLLSARLDEIRETHTTQWTTCFCVCVCVCACVCVCVGGSLCCGYIRTLLPFLIFSRRSCNNELFVSAIVCLFVSKQQDQY